MSHLIRLFILIGWAGGSCIFLGACTTTTTTPAPALTSSSSSSSTSQDLTKTQDSLKALANATTLRKEGYFNKAALTLDPFIDEPNAALQAEFAHIEISRGRYMAAYDRAVAAVAIDPTNYKAYYLMGLSLEAQGEYSAAEKAYRKSLNVWQGSPLPILNALGLNLANQGFLTEATTMLNKAASLDPSSPEVEANRRAVEILIETNKNAVKPRD